MKITNEILVCEEDKKIKEIEKARLWKLIDFENEKGEETIVVMLQEPCYFDDSIEKTIITCLNFLIKNGIQVTDEKSEDKSENKSEDISIPKYKISKIYFVNNCCTNKEYIKFKQKDDLEILHNQNKRKLEEIINKDVYVIDGRGSLSSQDKNFLKAFNLEIDNLLKKGKKLLYFKRNSEHGIYPGDRGGKITGLTYKKM